MRRAVEGQREERRGKGDGQRRTSRRDWLVAPRQFGINDMLVLLYATVESLHKRTQGFESAQSTGEPGCASTEAQAAGSGQQKRRGEARRGETMRCDAMRCVRDAATGEA